MILALLLAIAANSPQPQHGLQFRTPSMVWDEALPLGNGMLGALVWGDGKPLRISLECELMAHDGCSHRARDRGADPRET